MRDYESEIAALRESIKLLEKERETARKERMAAVKPVYQFKLTLVKPDYWNRLREDCGVSIYNLSGKVTNKEELVAAGHPIDNLEGSMNYLVNWETKPLPKIIRYDGGGRIFFGEFNKESEQTTKIFNQLEQFLFDNPHGGDVTHIIPAKD